MDTYMQMMPQQQGGFPQMGGSGMMMQQPFPMSVPAQQQPQMQQPMQPQNPFPSMSVPATPIMSPVPQPQQQHDIVPIHPGSALGNSLLQPGAMMRMEPPKLVPDWLRNVLIIAAAASLVMHPLSRNAVSNWLPMVSGEAQSRPFGLAVTGLMIGAVSVTALRLSK
jgi:hypothetical protein